MKVAIVGAGKLGLAITEALLGGGNEITLIDKDEGLIQKVSGRYDILTVTANAKRVDVMKELKGVKTKAPVHMGDVVVTDVLGLGVDIIASKSIVK